ncbi:MAG TPA: SUMF1/EgtB/PvdO family nonheme iron enzyme [Candidatus Hydrogenedentes bacterium]|nr:SUMF1/EgtB/PvdO family nonheme iron enzyme [Candidatus Hydrogenedentota bacterium]HPG68525.1 SUMF1/EgtB/PvdO family nonheme iron enzyme [Candidatus Hydrogenedentota bacterium]
MTRLAFILTCAVTLVSCGKPAPFGSTHAAPSKTQRTEITTPSGVPMILVPGGAFTMGSTEGADDEAPPHTVSVSSFAMDTYEVTQDQFANAQEPNPSHFKGPRRPVEQIRWSDAALFCNIRSRMDGLEPCYDEFSFECHFDASGYRLPTEAEWEYAARAGADTVYDFGNDARELKAYACYANNATEKTDESGRKRPNRWGFHDLYGNVAEWCHDAYSATYYAESPETDPRGPDEGVKRVMRGGAWNSGADACRATARAAESPGITDACFARDTFGFRCVRRINEDEAAKIR